MFCLTRKTRGKIIKNNFCLYLLENFRNYITGGKKILVEQKKAGEEARSKIYIFQTLLSKEKIYFF